MLLSTVSCTAKARGRPRAPIPETRPAAGLTIEEPEGLPAKAREKAKPLNLKVTGLKTFVVNAGSAKNYVFVKIFTNQGITGLGEGSITSKAATVEQAILEHERYLVGRDPTKIEMHWQAMFRWPRWRGGPVLNSAISAVEIALWDILGQAVGQPVWQLLGDPQHAPISPFARI